MSEARFLPRALDAVVHGKAQRFADLLPHSFPFQKLSWQLIIYLLDVEMAGGWGGGGGVDNSRVQGSREIHVLHVCHMPDTVFGAFPLVSSLLLTRTLWVHQLISLQMKKVDQ